MAKKKNKSKIDKKKSSKDELTEAIKNDANLIEKSIKNIKKELEV